ncbi:MAG: SAM-dependent methyltransferase, partial [Rikenellaceae bacterium]
MDVITTLDGSSTIVSEHFPNQLYHSDRGAIGEALHTYIQFLQDGDNVLEFGFGSGLNALLSLKTGLNLNYTTLEHYPIDLGTAQKLTFYSPELGQLHTAPWEKEVVVNPNFLFTKHNLDIEQFSKLYSSKLATRSYDRIFFDAFAPDIVPNQWSEEVFSAL